MTIRDPAAPLASRAAVALKWFSIVAAGVVVVLLVAAAVLDANADALRGPLVRTASTHLNRPVHIDGRLELHLFSWHPRVLIHGLRIANPDWVSRPSDMARIGQLQVTFSANPSNSPPAATLWSPLRPTNPTPSLPTSKPAARR